MRRGVGAINNTPIIGHTHMHIRMRTHRGRHNTGYGFQRVGTSTVDVYSFHV